MTIEEGLRETDFGAWEGLTFGEVRERYPDDLTTWLVDPTAQPTGGGESFADTATRIAATRDKLTATYAGRTVLLREGQSRHGSVGAAAERRKLVHHRLKAGWIDGSACGVDVRHR